MINVYSKSDSELGRLLSNFAHTPFNYKGRWFQSVEGFWYWHISGGEYKLRTLYGAMAKKIGQKYLVENSHPSKALLKLVYYAKLQYNPHIERMLRESTEDFTHMYNINGELIPVKKWMWTAELWGEIREELKNETYG